MAIHAYKQLVMHCTEETLVYMLLRKWLCHLCTQWHQQTQTTMACGSHMLGIRGYALIVRITSPVALGQAVVPLNHQVHRSENLSKRWQPTAVWRSCHNTSTKQRCWVFTSLVLAKEWAQYILNTHPTSLVLFSDNIEQRYLMKAAVSCWNVSKPFIGDFRAENTQYLQLCCAQGHSRCSTAKYLSFKNYSHY